MNENLHSQLLALILLCLFGAFAFFLIVYFSIRTYHRTRHSREYAEASLRELRWDFQSTVLEEKISSADTEAIGRWVRGKRASVFVEGRADPQTGEPDLRSGAGRDGPVLSMAPVIRYQDGDAVTRFVYTPLRPMSFVAFSLLLAFDVFLLLLFGVLKRKLNYISRIETGVGILESGRLDYTIAAEGSDELARLASGINRMSRSIRKALKANRELIGDLSHDIRTPLTVGMGYLTLLLEKEDLSERERREYLALALKKAEQIKERTRALLDFATLTSGQMPVRKTVIDARTVADQLKAELSALAELRAEDDLPAGVTLSGDVELLERLFDNLLSNLQRHGDRSAGVDFRASLKDGNLHLEIENAVSQEPRAKGTSLGLKICACILDLHGGTFKTIRDGKNFKTQITLPQNRY